MSSATLIRDRPVPAAPEARRSVVLAGIAAAAWVVALTWAAIVALVIVGWSTAGSSASAATATRLGSQLWLLVHHVELQLSGIGGGSITLAPLGLTIGVVALMYRGGIVAARSSGARTLMDCARTAAAFALPYTTVAVVVAGASRSVGVRASVWQAALFPGVLALGVTWIAAVRHAGVQDQALVRVPGGVRVVGLGVLRFTVVWFAAGLALLVVATTLSASRVDALIVGAHAGSVGTVILTLATLAFAPNGAVWAGSYAIGGGVTVGSAAVSPFSVTGGALPALPPLAVLPQSTPSAVLQLLVVALPVIAFCVAWRVARAAAHPGERWWLPYARTTGLAVGAGAAVTVLAVLASGTVGSLTLGPHPLRDGGLSVAGALVAGATAVTMQIWEGCDPRTARLSQALRTRLRAVAAGVHARVGRRRT